MILSETLQSLDIWIREYLLAVMIDSLFWRSPEFAVMEDLGKIVTVSPTATTMKPATLDLFLSEVELARYTSSRRQDMLHGLEMALSIVFMETMRSQFYSAGEEDDWDGICTRPLQRRITLAALLKRARKPVVHPAPYLGVLHPITWDYFNGWVAGFAADDTTHAVAKLGVPVLQIDGVDYVESMQVAEDQCFVWQKDAVGMEVCLLDEHLLTWHGFTQCEYGRSKAERGVEGHFTMRGNFTVPPGAATEYHLL